MDVRKWLGGALLFTVMQLCHSTGSVKAEMVEIRAIQPIFIMNAPVEGQLEWDPFFCKNFGEGC